MLKVGGVHWKKLLDDETSFFDGNSFCFMAFEVVEKLTMQMPKFLFKNILFVLHRLKSLAQYVIIYNIFTFIIDNNRINLQVFHILHHKINKKKTKKTIEQRSSSS